MKFKDYYNSECATLLAAKIAAVYPEFNQTGFVQYITERVDDKEFSARQDIFADALELYLTGEYRESLKILTQI